MSPKMFYLPCSSELSSLCSMLSRMPQLRTQEDPQENHETPNGPPKPKELQDQRERGEGTMRTRMRTLKRSTQYRTNVDNVRPNRCPKGPSVYPGRSQSEPRWSQNRSLEGAIVQRVPIGAQRAHILALRVPVGAQRVAVGT